MNAHQHSEQEDLFPVIEMRGRLRTPTALRHQLRGGNSVLTFRSHVSGDRFTFKFTRPKEGTNGRRPIWVSVLTGADNESSYDFLGTIWEPNEKYLGWGYVHSAKSRVTDSAVSVKTIKWLCGWLTQSAERILDQAEVWHEGRCGRCGRRLTVPESIESGFGPECIKYVEGI